MTGLRRYLDPVDGPLAFIREQIVLSDGRSVGQAIDTDSWLETDVLRPIFERDEEGLPRHRLVYCELPRGHWKSGGGAAVAVAEVVLHDSTEVIVAAADRDQASIVGDNISGFLSRNPALARSFKVSRDSFDVPVRGSRIRIISSDAPTSWGLGGTHRRFREIADELTTWKSEDLWGSLASATGKVADAQTIVFSNAGFDAERSWQYRVRSAAEREPWGHLYSAPGIMASWVTRAWVEQMRSLLPPASFDRVILNRWTSAAGDFVTAEQFDRCVDPDWRSQRVGDGKSKYFAGLDLGLTKDATALAIVHLDEDDLVRLDRLVTWQGTRSAPVDIAGVEEEIVRCAERFPGLRVIADPWQLQGTIQRLSRGGITLSEHVFSSSSVARLSQTLYSLITGATLRVFPDPTLASEVLGLQVLQTPGGWRVDHRSGGFSDRAMALAMAAQAALEAGRPDEFVTPIPISITRESPWHSAGESWWRDASVP